MFIRMVVDSNQQRALRAMTESTNKAYLTTIINEGFKHNNRRYAIDHVANACNTSVESKCKLKNWAKHCKYFRNVHDAKGYVWRCCM